MAPHQSADNSLNFESFVTRAQGLTPLVIAEADEAERLQHLTDTVVHAFQEAGLYRVSSAVPSCLCPKPCRW